MSHMDQMTPAQLRAEAEEDLKPLGSRRIQQKQQLDETTEKIRPLVMRALECEVPHRRIEDLTGIARGTLQSWKRAQDSDQQ